MVVMPWWTQLPVDGITTWTGRLFGESAAVRLVRPQCVYLSIKMRTFQSLEAHAHRENRDSVRSKAFEFITSKLHFFVSSDIVFVRITKLPHAVDASAENLRREYPVSFEKLCG